MPYGREPIKIRFCEAKPHILDGDVLFYAGFGGFTSLAIRRMSLSEYAHVALAGWTNGEPGNPFSELMAYEMLWSGGQGHSLESHVEKRGEVHVYRVADSHTLYRWDPALRQVVGTTKVLNRKRAVYEMRAFCRPGEYGKMHLCLTALTRLPFIRFLFPQPSDDEIADRRRPPYCSEAVSYALRMGFTDVVRNTPDHYTSPGALARSPLLHYMFTLIT